MKALHLLPIVLFFMSICTNNVAQEKSLTLEDLIPGGKNYSQFTSRLNVKAQWYGDKLIITTRDTMYLADPEQPRKKEVFLTNKELRSWLNNDDANINNILFKDINGNFLATIPLYGTYNKIVCLDIPRKKIISEINFQSEWDNQDICFQNNRIAFTQKNNLYISAPEKSEPITDENNPDIVCGTEVHRGEFNITKGTFWSPKGNYLAFYRKDESMVENYPLVDISAREAKLKNIKYPMAGMKSHEVTVGIYDLASQKTVYLKTGYPKDRYFTNISWSPDEKSIYIAELNRGQDTCKLVRYNIKTGSRETILFEETSDTYVEPLNPLLFLKKNPDQFIWQSRRNGYNHLYLYHADGTLIKPISSGNFEVLQVIGTDEKEEYIYITSTGTSPIEEHTYKINMKTGKSTRLNDETGINTPTLSASGNYLLNEFSNPITPKGIELIYTSGKKSFQISESKNPFADYPMPEIELGTVKASDNQTDLHYRLVKPTNFDPSKKYPVIIYVYGGPHSQLVKKTWLSGARGWDIYMAEKGYLVFTLDNRGTSNRGRDFENIIHRRLGIIEAEDQMKGVEFLKSLPYVDAERIGIHGWSFGGFMTTNLMLRYPDTFKAGVAGGPVIDWKYYEVMYGERYMDAPQENKEGYENSNLNNLAKNLQGRLLLIHGDEDPVVVWQHSLSFLKACINARTYPDYFIYPGHEHNMTGPDRVHLHEKITRYFDDFLK